VTTPPRPAPTLTAPSPPAGSRPASFRPALPPGSRRTLGGALLTVALGAGLLGAGLLGAQPGTGAAVVTPPTPALPTAVEDLQPYVGQEGCDPVAKPGVLAFQSLLMTTYRDTGSLGIVRDCGIGGTSEHKEGRAFDWAVSVNNPQHVAEVAALTTWLTAYGPDFASTARRFGIMYMIWNHRIWKAYQPTLGWQPYSGANPHTDHVHFSFGWNGAKDATSWWSGRVAPLDYGPYNTSHPPAPVPPPPRPVTRTPIDVKHDQLGGDAGWMGPATGPEVDVLNGRYRPYRVGAIYYSAVTGAHEVHGDVQARYLALGGSRSVVGLPITDEVPVAGGSGSTFQRGRVLWSPTTGAHGLYGAVYGQYLALGGPDGLLRLPTAEEVSVNGGRLVTFQGGRVYWSAATGAHEVHGGILEAYLGLGAENSALRLPTANEANAGPGRGSEFQSGGLYWSPSTGVHAVQGAIHDKWLAVGGPSALLGLPTTSEGGEPGGASNTFTGGRIYWSPATGADQVIGAILGRYLQGGAVAGYGFPVRDEYGTATGSTQELQRAFLDYDRVTGAVAVRLK